MYYLKTLLDWIANLFSAETSGAEDSSAEHAAAVTALRSRFGITLIETDPKGNTRPWKSDEIAMLSETIELLGPVFSAPFMEAPIRVWIDRKPGAGHYGHQWLRIGDPQGDLSILYRILLHEGTHASNEYRGWPYETQFCTRPGLDWRREGEQWIHPRQQGRPAEPGEWETLPVSSRDVSSAPGEDLAEMVRYYVHSVRDEREWLWPLDQRMPALYLWDTSPTRFVYVRDHFLTLPEHHPLYKRLDTETEARVAAKIGGNT